MVGRRLIYLHGFLELANSTKSLFSPASWLGLDAGAGTNEKGNKNSTKIFILSGEKERERESLSRVHHGN